MILGVQGIKQIWTSCPLVHDMRGNQCLWKAVWLASPQGRCISCLDHLIPLCGVAVTVAVLQTREPKNKQVRSFPKVTLTVSDRVGKRAQHIPRTVASALGSTAHGHTGFLVYYMGYWLYAVQPCIGHPMHGCF